jgi:hypothetical protein
VQWVSVCAGLLSAQRAHAKPTIPTVDARAKTFFLDVSVIQATLDRPDVRDVPPERCKPVK